MHNLPMIIAAIVVVIAVYSSFSENPKVTETLYKQLEICEEDSRIVETLLHECRNGIKQEDKK